jgi:hypothetical protein
MNEGDNQNLDDLLNEETSRGRKQPKRAVTLARQRTIRRLAQLLAEPQCDKETFLDVIREIGLSDESAEFRQLLALWRKRRGDR